MIAFSTDMLDIYYSFSFFFSYQHPNFPTFLPLFALRESQQTIFNCYQIFVKVNITSNIHNC